MRFAAVLLPRQSADFWLPQIYQIPYWARTASRAAIAESAFFFWSEEFQGLSIAASHADALLDCAIPADEAGFIEGRSMRCKNRIARGPRKGYRRWSVGQLFNLSYRDQRKARNSGSCDPCPGRCGGRVNRRGSFRCGGAAQACTARPAAQESMPIRLCRTNCSRPLRPSGLIRRALHWP